MGSKDAARLKIERREIINKAAKLVDKSIALDRLHSYKYSLDSRSVVELTTHGFSIFKKIECPQRYKAANLMLMTHCKTC